MIADVILKHFLFSIALKAASRRFFFRSCTSADVLRVYCYISIPLGLDVLRSCAIAVHLKMRLNDTNLTIAQEAWMLSDVPHEKRGMRIQCTASVSHVLLDLLPMVSLWISS
ncbi:uncharacterized protein LAESUDRAFT_331288 [Laetiporus sulphureus 93-53]|uniref:Uncharacterized protein n=1 Tax=Laetiporus sulphureus 93-53 TaxID=1314785 RepID=A0A165CXH8_9APHY|nr:uncharacterized protein LAESUDRAFT_331288 [Laetiporus sulphureus 93-53]KZT03673.1 hypothetical protein LAESUDRAFT_331288 [Laetiporus sulphureus 93-53]